MATLSHESSGEFPEKARLRVPEMWTSLAIAVIWLVVLFDALLGPDIVSVNVTSTTHIPSAVVLALFAYLATHVVARYGFGRSRNPAD
jgi:hypothetical protein